MSGVISVRVNDAEQEMLTQASSVYGCGVSSLVKQLAFEKLEDEYDLQAIAEYEQEKASGTLELRGHDEVWKALGL